MLNQTNGIIIKSIGGLFTVETPDGILTCSARGKFRNINVCPYTGDNVSVTDIMDNKGVINKIENRKNEIIRPPLANLDQLIFVVSTCDPYPNLTLLDKFIAICEYKNIVCIIAVTKNDLKKNSELIDIYRNIGIEIFEIDYDNEDCCDKLYDMLANKISAFTGNTGVGKSTLLNHIDDRFQIKTAEISKKLGRGRHTTRHVELYKLDNGGYVADTPGFSTFETNKYDIILKEELQDCFVEFAEYKHNCKFSDCSHIKEKGCAVIDAVNQGLIAQSRYNSYVQMYEEAKAIKEWEIKE